METLLMRICNNLGEQLLKSLAEWDTEIQDCVESVVNYPCPKGIGASKGA
jgi:hypothetical protein